MKGRTSQFFRCKVSILLLRRSSLISNFSCKESDALLSCAVYRNYTFVSSVGRVFIVHHGPGIHAVLDGFKPVLSKFNRALNCCSRGVDCPANEVLDTIPSPLFRREEGRGREGCDSAQPPSFHPVWVLGWDPVGVQMPDNIL